MTPGHTATPAREGWVNQIVGYGEEPPESLLANPRNPKIHPKSQQDALAGALTELGWLGNAVPPVMMSHVAATIRDEILSRALLQEVAV